MQSKIHVFALPNIDCKEQDDGIIEIFISESIGGQVSSLIAVSGKFSFFSRTLYSFDMVSKGSIVGMNRDVELVS